MVNLKLILGLMLLGSIIFSACNISLTPEYPACVDDWNCSSGEVCIDENSSLHVCKDEIDTDIIHPDDGECDLVVCEAKEGCKYVNPGKDELGCPTCGELVCDGCIPNGGDGCSRDVGVGETHVSLGDDWCFENFDQSGEFNCVSCDSGFVWLPSSNNCVVEKVERKNSAPVVNAGSDFNVEVNNVRQLKGSVTDDGLPNNKLTTKWTKIVGPGEVKFLSPNLVDTKVIFKTAGTYNLRLTANDGEKSTSDEVTITATTATTEPSEKLKIISATQNAEYQEAANPIENSYDGDLQTRWAARPIPSEITFDLGEVKQVGETKFLFYDNDQGRIYKYSIDASTDNTHWTPVVTEKNSNEGFTIDTFTPLSARYIKLNFISQNQGDWAGLYEAEIWSAHDNNSVSKGSNPVCGNGVLESGEQCDDNNSVSGDGCSSICKTEQTQEWPPATLFIDPKNGNDANSGTSRSQAWKTIVHANSQVQPGDIVEFIGDETITKWNEYIHPKNSGTKDNPIIFRSEQGHQTTLANNNYKGHTILLNQGSYSDGKARNYITIKNFRIINEYWGRIDYTKGVVLENLDCMHYDEIHPEVQEVYGGDYWGVWGFRMQNTEYATIKNNKFYGSQVGSSQDILQMEGTPHHNVIENNMFHNAGHNTIDMVGNTLNGKSQPISNDARFNVIRNNYMFNEYHQAMNPQAGGYFTLIENNVIQRAGTGTKKGTGVKYHKMDGEGNELGAFSYGQQSNMIIRNNIVTRAGSGQVDYDENTRYTFGAFGNVAYIPAAGSHPSYVKSSINNHLFNNVFYKNWGTSVAAGIGNDANYDKSGDLPEYKDAVYKNNIFYKNGENKGVFPGTSKSANLHKSGEGLKDMFIYYSTYEPSYTRDKWNDKWLNNLMEDTDNDKIFMYNDYKYGHYKTLADLESGVSDLPSTTFDNNIQGDPKFQNPDKEYDLFDLDSDRNQFKLMPGSAAIDKGDFLTKTTNSGTNSKVIKVDDPYYFAGGKTPSGVREDLGWDGIIDGDIIQVGNDIVQITSINYDKKELTVDKSISWSVGEGVSMPYSGSKPDIGLFE